MSETSPAQLVARRGRHVSRARRRREVIGIGPADAESFLVGIPEQAKRLLAGYDGAAAIFAPNGALLYATAEAQALFGRNNSLTALKAMPLADTAFAA